LVAGANGKSLREFTGRPSYSWPADALSPITKPLFPLGYGLSYSKPANVSPVNEDPRVDESAASQAVSYMVRGKIWAPWHLALDGAVDAKTVDLSAQEDARQFLWKEAGKISIEGSPVNLQRQGDEGSDLLIDWRIDQAGSGPVLVSFAGAALDIRETLRAMSVGAITQTHIPLRCFSEAGSNLKVVGAPFRIDAAEGLVITIRNIRIDSADRNTPCPRKTEN
jgi:beta-glucosidase